MPGNRWRPARRSSASSVELALREVGHQLAIAGEPALVPDRPEPGTSEPAFVSEGELRPEGVRRVDVDRLPAGRRARIARTRGDGRRDRVEVDDFDRIELGGWPWVGGETQVVRRGPH